MNLLPNKEKEFLKKGLKLRFVIVALYLLTAFFVVGSIMLLPAYFLMKGQLSSIKLENYNTKTVDGGSIEEILNIPNEINAKLKFLQSNVGNLSTVDIFYKIINLVPEKVVLNSISFSRNQDYKEKTGIHILVSGLALDRGSLVSFSALLKDSNLFSLVDVPVSSLTKEKNLPFSMVLFIENQK